MQAFGVMSGSFFFIFFFIWKVELVQPHRRHWVRLNDGHLWWCLVVNRMLLSPQAKFVRKHDSSDLLETFPGVLLLICSMWVWYRQGSSQSYCFAYGIDKYWFLFAAPNIFIVLLIKFFSPLCFRLKWNVIFCVCFVCFPGKPFNYMPYEAREQDAHGGVGRPGTPYRLSPRDPNKASPQPDPARYSVPPGKQGTSAQNQFLSL